MYKKIVLIIPLCFVFGFSTFNSSVFSKEKNGSTGLLAYNKIYETFSLSALDKNPSALKYIMSTKSDNPNRKEDENNAILSLIGGISLLVIFAALMVIIAYKHKNRLP